MESILANFFTQASFTKREKKVLVGLSSGVGIRSKVFATTNLKMFSLPGFRAVARPWRKRRLPRAPDVRERKKRINLSSKIINLMRENILTPSL